MPLAVRRKGAKRLALVLLASALPGCGSCGGGAELRESPHPHRACLLADEPDARKVSMGDATLTIEGRVARLDGRSTPLRLSAFRGADDETAELPRAASAIDEEGVSLLVVLGGLGRTGEEALAHLEALSLTRKPIVLVPGGDDSLAAIDDALGALDDERRARIVDARSTYVLEAGGQRWLLVPGAPTGRYAYSSDACGFLPSDLDARRDELGEGAHLTLGWAAPDEGRGIFAFPGGDSEPGRVFVGPIAGPPHFSGETYRAPGPTLLELGPSGELRSLGTIAFRRDARMVRPPAP